MTKSVEVRAGERRRALTEAALAVLVRDGMHALSTRAVAREAGMNVAMIHYTFDSMERLVLAVVERCVEQTRAVLACAPVEGLSLTEGVECLAHAYWHHVVAEPALSRAQYELTLHALTVGREEAARAQYNGYVEVTAEKLALTCDATAEQLHVLAGSCVGMIDGLVLQFLATGDRERCEQSLRVGIDLLAAYVRENEATYGAVANWPAPASGRWPSPCSEVSNA